jgi:hypothetical protein
MKYYPETKELKGVCVTDDGTMPHRATNSSDLMLNIKSQMEDLICDGCTMGVFGLNGDVFISLSNAAFTYSNPQIIDNKLYIDIKLLDTPKGLLIQNIVDDLSNCQFVLSGIGVVEQDKSITDYKLISVNFISRTNF